GQADDDDHRHRRRVAGQVGHGPSDQDGGAGHGQAPESVDDPGLQILREPDAGGSGEEDHVHDQHTRQQVLDVVAAQTGLDQAPEHHTQADQEEHGLHGAEEDELRGTAEADEV